MQIEYNAQLDFTWFFNDYAYQVDRWSSDFFKALDFNDQRAKSFYDRLVDRWLNRWDLIEFLITTSCPNRIEHIVLIL